MILKYYIFVSLSILYFCFPFLFAFINLYLFFILNLYISFSITLTASINIDMECFFVIYQLSKSSLISIMILNSIRNHFLIYCFLNDVYLFYFILLFNHLKYITASYIIWRKAVLKFGQVYSLVKNPGTFLVVQCGPVSPSSAGSTSLISSHRAKI